MIGCRGTFSIEAAANEFVKIKWSFTGLYAKPTGQDFSAASFSQVIPPRFTGASFAIDSYNAAVANLKTGINNTIAKRTDASHAIGVREYIITNRNVTGDIDIEAAEIATKDFYAMWEGNNRVLLNATVGQTAGNKCVISAPAVIISDIKYGDREGILTKQVSLVFTPDTGNDEIKFSFQ
ncbi:MAG: hypothetical protein HZB80_11295 [Deltaproteobacteria bacterium]|nr:hypothetical protein [Deltaproteobacteria bacterium]